MEIKRFPFNLEFEQKMMNGKKTKTSRNKKYGNAGDTFTAFGVEFEIVDVKKETLKKVAEEYYKDEGFDMPGDFIEKWDQLHPRKGWHPEKYVFVHTFKRKI